MAEEVSQAKPQGVAFGVIVIVIRGKAVVSSVDCCARFFGVSSSLLFLRGQRFNLRLRFVD